MCQHPPFYFIIYHFDSTTKSRENVLHKPLGVSVIHRASCNFKTNIIPEYSRFYNKNRAISSRSCLQAVAVAVAVAVFGVAALYVF